MQHVIELARWVGTRGSSMNPLCPQDGGGRPQSSGERPCQRLLLSSERDLQLEVNSIAGHLLPDVDWEKRIAALERFEGLVTGNAPDLGPAFDAAMRSLQEPLIQQITDR